MRDLKTVTKREQTRKCDRKLSPDIELAKERADGRPLRAIDAAVSGEVNGDLGGLPEQIGRAEG
jgi:hypothetical protein